MSQDLTGGRHFDDFTAARNDVFSGFREAASALKPVEFGGRRLEVLDVGYDASDEDDESERFNYASQAAAVRDKRTLGRRLRGTFRMTDLNTGQVLDEKRSLLATVPRVNEDGTMIYRGARYNVVNQQRLKPGIFGRVKKNQELETFVNSVSGPVGVHRYLFTPASGRFYVNVGNSRIPLTTMLKTLGATDDQIKAAWGEELASKNVSKNESQDLNKLYQKLVPRKLQDPAADKQYKQMAIRQVLDGVKLDKWSVKRLLGVETDKLTPDLILKATAKTLAMSRGDSEGDDRDHLAYQSIHSVEDLLKEYVANDVGFEQRNAMRKVLRNSNLKGLQPKLLQKQIEGVIFGSGLGIQPEYANPLDAWDRATRITKMGFGGIGSTDALPMESRDYHISHQAFLDPARTSESLKVGVDLNVVSQAVKGKDGKLRTPLLNNRTGKIEYLSAEEVVDKKVAFSNKQEVPGYVIVNKSGRESYVKPEEVDYVVPHAESVFSGVANLIPMKMHQPHNRSAMGSRFLTQSLPIKNREQPWVQSAVPGTNKSQSFYRLYSHRVGAIESKVPGKVKSVSEDRIVISTEQGDKVHWLNRRNPLGSKSQLNNTPVVKPGDVVQAGDLLASSNFTDDQGNIAVGLNASVAIMPWGDNYEDAYTISESFAKRMAGLMSYEYESRADGKTNTNKNDFLSALPRQFSRSQLGQIDDDGVVKVGTKLNRGDPILLGMKKKETNLSKKLARSGHLRFMDQSQTWEHDYVGEVTGVHRNKRGDKVVTIEAETPLKAGDKLGALYGSKGVVAILPDDQMVHDKNGKPFDIASSDLGFISRQNSSRALAMMLGKIAQKRGKPYLVEELEEDVDLPKLIREELKAEGLSATETVVDPVSGREIEGVLTGPEYMLRLSHTAESKSAARGTGAYGQDEQPSKGSGDDMQAKRLSNQELGALVSHGAWEYLRDAALVRGQRNDEYVARFVNGYDLPPPKVPLVYQKFLGYLQGMGVNPVREGSKTKLLLMGDKDIEQLAGNRKLLSAETVNLAKNMKPIKGGLFDQAIFGEEGNRFAYFELADPIPHPLMEDVFRNLMGTTKQGFRDILAGRQQLGTHGTGPGAISKWLEQLKPAQELSVALRQAQGASKTKREAALKRIRFLQGMVKQQIDPKDLMLSKVPIIPPKFRPVSKLADKDTPLVDGMNLLYQEMVSADENLRSVRDFSSDVGSERLAVYDAVQAAVGLRQPLSPELRQKQVKGIMARLKGGSPKTSYVQSKLLSGTVDDVGRAVATSNANLKLDEIGLPEEQAWKIFEMPVLRRLRRNNIPLMEAKELIANRHERARRALLDEMEVRPIAASRAPILHKYGKLAFMPKLVKGRSLQVNPLVFVGYNLDLDGDAMNFHAIISDEAVAEAKKKMLPSKNLLSPKDFETPMFVPNQDHALGIYLASAKEPRGRPVKFASKQAAMAAFKRGQIAIDTPIEIIGNS